MRTEENAHGSTTSSDWLKSEPSVLQRALIGLLTSARTTETLARQASYAKSDLNRFHFGNTLKVVI